MNHDFPCPLKKRKITYKAVNLDNTNFVSLLSQKKEEELKIHIVLLFEKIEGPQPG